MARTPAPIPWSVLVALAALWWFQRGPVSVALETAVVVLHLAIAAFTLWVGDRDPEFAARHPGYAWTATGGAAFVAGIVLLRADAREWHVVLVLAGCLLFWRGLRLDRRVESGRDIADGEPR